MIRTWGGASLSHRHCRTIGKEDIVRVTVIRRFDVEVGTCACCGRQAQGRHSSYHTVSGEPGTRPRARVHTVRNFEAGAAHYT